MRLPALLSRCVAAAPFVVAFLEPPAAHADALAKPTAPEARVHLGRGSRLYVIRSFAEAIQEYKAGVLIEPAPVFDWNLGQCYRMLSRHKEALWHYERFLSRGKPDGQVLELTNKYIAEMKQELARATTTEGDPARPAPEDGKYDRSDRMPARRGLTVGVGAGGVAIIGLGIGLGLRARAFDNNADEICPMEMCMRADEANKLIDRGKTNALFANVAFGIGASAIVGAAVLWITSSARKRTTTVVTPHLSATSVGLVGDVRF